MLVPYPAACLVCPAACGHGWRPRPSCRWHVGRLCLLRVRRIPYRLCPVPRAALLPVLLLVVIRPVLRHGGRGARLAAFVLGWLVARSRCLSSLGRAERFRVRMACYHPGSFDVGSVVLCGLCGWSGCLPFLWYIGIVNWLYISFDWIFDMAGLPAATVIVFECSLIDNAILIEIGGGELPILEPDKSIKYSGLAASRIADFVLEHDYGIPDYLKAADFLEDGNQRLARAIRFVVNSLRVP